MNASMGFVEGDHINHYKGVFITTLSHGNKKALIITN